MFLLAYKEIHLFKYVNLSLKNNFETKPFRFVKFMSSSIPCVIITIIRRYKFHLMWHYL